MPDWIVEGDAMDSSLLKNAIKTQDIVYVNLAGNLEEGLYWTDKVA